MTDRAHTPAGRGTETSAEHAGRLTARSGSRVNTRVLAEAFCCLPLPTSVCADLCTTDSSYAYPRAGTNLLTVDQAQAMFDHLVSSGLILPALDRAPRPDLAGSEPTASDLLNSLLVDVGTLCDSVLGDAYLGNSKEVELAERLRAEAANTDAAAFTLAAQEPRS